MAEMALETVFQMFIYIVVIMVVIGIIIYFRENILSALNLCDYIPGGCPQREECSVIHSTETSITETVLNKYCSFCWGKTGAKNYGKDCICYVVSGTFSPMSYVNEHCELKCSREATSLVFTYNQLFGKIFIEC